MWDAVFNGSTFVEDALSGYTKLRWARDDR